MRRLAAAVLLAGTALAAAPAHAGPGLPGPGQSLNCWLQQTLGYENVQACDGTSG